MHEGTQGSCMTQGVCDIRAHSLIPGTHAFIPAIHTFIQPSLHSFIPIFSRQLWSIMLSHKISAEAQ